MKIIINNHPGGIIQNTDKPIVNIQGDVVIEKGEKKQTVVNPNDDYYEFEEVDSETCNEGVKKDESPRGHQTGNEEKLNLNTPQIVLQNMLQEDWVDTVCRNTKLYTKEWRSKMVEELMASEYGSSIAKDWMFADKRQKMKAELLGTLSNAGVLDNNKSAIARAYLDIDKNTRDIDEKRGVNTFSNYIGLGKNALYYDWVKDYVESTTKNSRKL